jgi:hypothetical protein
LNERNNGDGAEKQRCECEGRCQIASNEKKPWLWVAEQKGERKSRLRLAGKKGENKSRLWVAEKKREKKSRLRLAGKKRETRNTKLRGSIEPF